MSQKNDDTTPYWWQQWKDDAARADERAERDATEYRRLVLEELKDLRKTIDSRSEDWMRLELEWANYKGRAWGIVLVGSGLVNGLMWIFDNFVKK